MKIHREPVPTVVGPPDWFTGPVYYETYVEPGAQSSLLVGLVRFAPGGRTFWHAHAKGQTLVITDGTGWVQRRGGPVETVRSGDRVEFAPYEEHWHGATSATSMAHLAIYELDDRDTIGAPVTDAECRAG